LFRLAVRTLPALTAIVIVNLNTDDALHLLIVLSPVARAPSLRDPVAPVLQDRLAELDDEINGRREELEEQLAPLVQEQDLIRTVLAAMDSTPGRIVGTTGELRPRSREGGTQKERTLAYLRAHGPSGVAEIEAGTGIERPGLNTLMSRLRREGEVTNANRRWTLAQ
jgi:hypothetical protein